MGTWSTAINGNDEFMSVYETFKDLYAEYFDNQWPYELPQLKEKLAENFSFILSNRELSHEYWFALAKAFWDYGIDDPSAFREVEKIIRSGENIEVWRSLDASAADLKKRQKVLDSFLEKISTPNPKPVQRKKLVKYAPPFKGGQLLAFKDKAGMYYAAVVTHEMRDQKGRNVVHILNYRSEKKPTKEDLLDTPLMVHTKESPFKTDTSANPTVYLMHGFLLTLKGFEKRKVEFEKIGEVSFHPHGFYKDGLQSFFSMEKYSWDTLPVLAELNYTEHPTSQPPALLRFYTTDLEIDDQEVIKIIAGLAENRAVEVHSVKFVPADLYGWILRAKSYNNVWMNILFKDLNKQNPFFVRNLVRRIMASWVGSKGENLDSHFFNVDDYDSTPEEGRSLYIPISDMINKVENGEISLKQKRK